jgi:hypothetical protein
MSQKVKIIDHDVVYLSYDEPNAERNYADLLKKIPWAKRVHGVDGSDSAHKACAKLATTERVTIIDGDNIVDANILSQEIEFQDHADLSKCVLSWGAKNIINGLIYGNGGIKCWPTQLILDMRTHENADPANEKTQVDFCWDINYIQMSKCMSDVHNNASPQQAWRAGFREGVKMSLLEGSKIDPNKLFDTQIHWKNYHRLCTWLNVGADVENGHWAIYGARQGCHMTNLTDWDFTEVRDFKWLNNFWETKASGLDEQQLKSMIIFYGEELCRKLNILTGPTCMTPEQSKFFKAVYTNPPRMKSNLVIE